MRKRCSHGLRLFLVLTGAVTLAACAATRETVDGWFGTAPAPAAGASSGARVYYSGMDGLKMYSEPTSSSKVTGRLSLHEKVTRSKVERGYAYVETDSGQTGWVDNAQLLWRLPSAVPAAAPAAESEEQDVEPEEEGLSEPTATATEPVRAATPAPARPKADQTPAGVAPSIFDAY
jgi:hypothetical protein